MRVRVHGCIGVCVFMRAWVHECMDVWVHGCMGVWAAGRGYCDPIHQQSNETCAGMGAWVYGYVYACMGVSNMQDWQRHHMHPALAHDDDDDEDATAIGYL